MKIAILGTRGIPNRYGGFEQCAEYLAEGLVKRGHEITVYNSNIHPYKEDEWHGVKIIHCHNPEDKLGAAGLFFYDLNCIKDARKRNYDIILMLGYTSSSVWGWLLPKNTVVTTNMDGLEWKRSKYSKPVRLFLRKAEWLATVYSDYWIADSIGIQTHLQTEFNIESEYIPYGADIFDKPDVIALETYNVSAYNYNMLIARLEPENSIEIILDGVVAANAEDIFLVIGKHETRYGEYLKNKYKTNTNIRFIGGIYDINMLNNLRWFSNIYFHGHTVGGTNPSLLEAMASGALICAHKNLFNESILGNDALYFKTPADVATVLSKHFKQEQHYTAMLQNNFEKIRKVYNWTTITDAYLAHFENICGKIMRGKKKNNQQSSISIR